MTSPKSSNAMANLPNALKTKPMASISTMSIETNILEPITFSNSGCLFVLTNKGILDSGSRITFSCTCPAGTDMFYYGKTGISALIERATLRIGTTIVAETDSFGQYETIRKQFKTNEELLQKDSVKCGYWASHVDDSGEGKGQLAYGRGVDNSAGVAAAVVDSKYKLTSDVSTTPIFSIGMSELFPMMHSVQLPLFVMAEAVSIDLRFKTQVGVKVSATRIGGDIAGVNYSTADATDITVVPNKENCAFIADYLTYTGDDGRMAETARIVSSEKGMVFPYQDLVLSASTIPSVADPGANIASNQEIVRDIGLSGSSISTLVFADESPQAATTSWLLGPYISPAFITPDSFNINVNDNIVYNRPVVSETRRQSELAQVFGTDINVSMAEFCNNGHKDPTTLATANPLWSVTAKLEGHSQNTSQGLNHYNGINLNTSPVLAWGSGQLVGQKPIRITRTLPRSTTDYQARTQNCWAMVERVFNLKSGQVMVSA